MKLKRIKYIIFTIILLVIEILIGVFVHDNFIRPYIGDVLVVAVIYTFLRIFIPEKVKLLPLWIFVFAFIIELLQLIDIVGILGIEKGSLIAIIIGSTFDLKDVICYGVGCILIAVSGKVRGREVELDSNSTAKNEESSDKKNK